ncbi:MAG: hypothetical protein ABH851_06180 [Methanobacteriota archaeon]
MEFEKGSTIFDSTSWGCIVKRNLRTLICVVLSVILLSLVSLYLIDSISDKTWLSIGDIHCGWNPWASIIAEKSLSLPMAVKEYYLATLGVEIFDVKTIHWYLACSACDCSTGYVRVLVSKNDETKMLNSGFQKISRLKLYYDITWTKRKKGYY